MGKKICLMMAVFILVFTGYLFAQEFSADVVTTSKDGNFTGKLYVAKDKVRMENAQSIMISRLDKNIMWLCLPDQKMYMEQPIDMSSFAASAEKMPGEINRELMGQEDIDGHMTDKYKVSYSFQGSSGTTYVWITRDSNIPIRTMAGDGSWKMEYKNFQAGTQRADLFELPAGYQKLSMDTSMMGNMPMDLGDLGIQ
ncbi:MAG: DUF4412 domain-containing protein [Candidatus Omnitrophota bacterium]